MEVYCVYTAMTYR